MIVSLTEAFSCGPVMMIASNTEGFISYSSLHLIIQSLSTYILFIHHKFDHNETFFENFSILFENFGIFFKNGFVFHLNMPSSARQKKIRETEF